MACLAQYWVLLGGIPGQELDRRRAGWKFAFTPDSEVKPHAYVECTHPVQLPAEEKIEMISGSSADAKFSWREVWAKMHVGTVVCPSILPWKLQLLATVDYVFQSRCLPYWLWEHILSTVSRNSCKVLLKMLRYMLKLLCCHHDSFLPGLQRA